MSEPLLIELETCVYHTEQCEVSLDIARDSNANRISPQKTLILFHGGGLFRGSRRARFPPYPVKLLLKRGWVVIVPDYYLLPEASISDIMDDLNRLETWIGQHSQCLKLDAKNIAVDGSSAGEYAIYSTPTSMRYSCPRLQGHSCSLLAISTWT